MLPMNMVTYEFNRESRLLTPGQFQQVFSKSSRFGSSHFTVLITKNQHNKPRLGFAVAKKRVKLAVQRNRIKRIARESFRLHQHDIPSIDIVILVKSGIDNLDNATIDKQLVKVWRKIIQRHKS